MATTKEKNRRNSPDQVVCGLEGSRGPPEVSVLVASSSIPCAYCHCCDANKVCGTFIGTKEAVCMLLL